MPLYKINSLLMFKHTYIIEADSLEDALDEFTMKDSGSFEDGFDEVYQEYLDEILLDSQETNEEEFKELCQKQFCGDYDEWMEKLIRRVDYTTGE